MTSLLSQAGSQSIGGFNASSNNRRTKSAEQVESVISGEVWKKQIRMKTFFEDYDKLRKGHCIDDKFISGLNTALSFLSINLTQEQLNTLVEKYRMPPGDLIKYKDFVNNIDAQFFNTDLARSNLQFLKGSHVPAQEERQILEKLLAYIRWMVSSKRVLIKSPMQDYDRTKCSFITKDQFARVLDNLGLVQNQKLSNLLSKHYARSNNPKQIAYTDFIKDVEDIKANEEFVVKGIVFNSKFKESRNITDPHAVSLTQEFYIDKKLPTKALPVQQIIKKMQAIVTMRRIRVRQFFIDFDGLRKNIVTGQQFKRVLFNLGISLSDSEYGQILNAYRVSDGGRDQRIRWMNFCDDVDSVFTTKEIQKDPLAKVSQIDKSVFEPIKKIEVQFTPEEEAIIEDLLQNYRTAIKHQRVLMKPLFEDFDITKIGYVTKNQFVRILKQFNYVPKAQEQFNLLLKKYMDRGNFNEVNYYEFIRDVDKYFEDSHNQAKTYASQFDGFKYQERVSKATIKSDIPNDLEDLLNRIRRKVKEERIRIAQFMKDFDKLRHGNITKDQFRLSLGMGKLPLSQSEFTLILDHFQCQNKPNYIRWKDFVDTIDQVFTIKELEKQSPQKNPQLARTEFVYGRQPISAQQEAIANNVKNAFRDYLLANRMDTKDLFKNWDKLSRFKVSAKQFRQVLATVGFSMTEEQSKAICKMYTTDDQMEVKYLDFLEDTKPFDFAYMTEIKETFKRGTGMPKSIPENIEEILSQLRKISKINRLRYKQYFKDFDPLNKGTMKKNKFKSVLYQTMKVPMDEKVFNKLEDYYGDLNDQTMINYANFTSDIDIVFNLPDSAKDPITRPPNFDYTITHSKKEEESIDSLMRRLGEVVRKHRLLLKPYFQDKDVAKIGKVSFTRMRSILDNNKLPLSDYQYQLLCQNFSFDGEEFNYVDFIEALKQYEQSC